MEASLSVPTATSYRQVPAKLLEVNRKIINGYLGRTRGGKISFTHIIGFAVVRAIHDTVPVMRSEEHTSELQSLMRISYAVFCLKKKKKRDAQKLNAYIKQQTITKLTGDDTTQTHTKHSAHVNNT